MLIHAIFMSTFRKGQPFFHHQNCCFLFSAFFHVFVPCFFLISQGARVCTPRWDQRPTLVASWPVGPPTGTARRDPRDRRGGRSGGSGLESHGGETNGFFFEMNLNEKMKTKQKETFHWKVTEKKSLENKKYQKFTEQKCWSADGCGNPIISPSFLGPKRMKPSNIIREIDANHRCQYHLTHGLSNLSYIKKSTTMMFF